MAIAVPILGVSCAAFLVWLMVRMVRASRERSSSRPYAGLQLDVPGDCR